MTALLLSIFCLAIIPTGHALVPRACAHNFTTEPSVCCPIPKGYSSPCGYPTRGRCLPVQIYQPIFRKRDLYFISTDIRYMWPSRLYNMTCECNGLYWGPDCGECRFGYSGKDCTKRQLTVRRSIVSLNAKERQLLLDVFVKIRTLKSEYVVPKLEYNQHRWNGEFLDVDPYEFVNFCHTVGTYPDVSHNTSRCVNFDLAGWDHAHDDVVFPMFHRYLMLLYERMMARVALEHFGIKNFALPYWDWTNRQDCDICTDDLIGASSNEYDPEMRTNYISKKSPFGDPTKWPVYCQSYHGFFDICEKCHFNRSNPLRASRGFTSYDHPSVDEIIELMAIPQYDNLTNWCSSFERVMELGYYCVCEWKSKPFTLHVKLHRYLLGTFGPLTSTAFDPIFLLHHIQVDRLYERWLRGVKPAVKELRDLTIRGDHCANCNLPAFFPTVTAKELFTDSRRWGYTYDNFDFGPLSEKVKIAYPGRVYEKKSCPSKVLTSL